MLTDRKQLIYKLLIILFIFVLGFSLRLVFAPTENETADPFEVLTAAQTLAETGKYLVPGIGSADLKIHYTFAGWPVGFPLMLSVVFKLFGYSEFLARLFTIFLGSLTIIFVAIIANIFFRDKVAYLASLLTAIHPLLVAFNGRIFTNTPALLFMTASVAFLLLSVVERDKELRFVDPCIILKNNKRLFSFFTAFLLLGFSLTIRDTEAMFIPVYLYVLYKSDFFRFDIYRARMTVIIKLFSMAGMAFIVGYLPSIYYNYQNYGTIITSTHYQWGGRLDLNYLLFGSGSIMGLPGAVVILITGLMYCFPLISLFFIKKFTEKDAFFLNMFILMFLPIIIINGSYNVSSTGASPRYMLPLISVVSIISAHSLMNLSQNIRLFGRVSLLLIILIWQLFLTYPIPVLFKISPKFAYAAHYAPVYQVKPFENYPTHINALTKWVKNHTPENSVILVTSSQPYHFFYYARRDVITFPNVTANVLKETTNNRPVFLVEDHEATYNPTEGNKIKDLIKKHGLKYSKVGVVELFSPHVGHTQMYIYEIVHSNEAS